MEKIKVIAFDLIGVLARETDFKLSSQYDKLERLFGRDISNKEFEKSASMLVGKDNIDNAIDYIILNLYETKNKDNLKKIKEQYTNIKIVLATNHVSNIKKFIDKEFVNIFDELFISADMQVNKPNANFYQKILSKLKILPQELLFVDDNLENIEGAKNLGIQTIHLTREKDLFDEVIKILEK